MSLQIAVLAAGDATRFPNKLLMPMPSSNDIVLDSAMRIARYWSPYQSSVRLLVNDTLFPFACHRYGSDIVMQQAGSGVLTAVREVVDSCETYVLFGDNVYSNPYLWGEALRCMPLNSFTTVQVPGSEAHRFDRYDPLFGTWTRGVTAHKPVQVFMGAMRVTPDVVTAAMCCATCDGSDSLVPLLRLLKPYKTCAVLDVDILDLGVPENWRKLYDDPSH